MFLFRFTLLILLLCVFISQVPAKHIIVAYDISGSMHKVKGQRLMYEADLDRLNKYLTQILFTGVPRNVLDRRDRIILPFDSDALYQDGDLLSYFRFATMIHNEFTRQPNVSDENFVHRLPETSEYAGYQGQDTEMSKARVHIYEDLYHKDEKTYWILVSDEDEDLSVGGTKSPVLKTKLARFEREFYQPPVFELLVNNHVTIRIRQIFRYERLPQSTDAVYVATSQNSNCPAQIVAFSKDIRTGVFRSENLRLGTSNTEKGDFQLNHVEAKIVSEDGQTLLNLEEVLLNNISPPKSFQLALPPNFSSGANTQNQLQITIHYKYRELPKERSFSLSYMTIIDTLYLALKAKPNKPIDIITFVNEGDAYVNKEPLALYSESKKLSEFQINDITFAVTTQGGNELYAETIPMGLAKLPAPLSLISIPSNTKQFKKRTNQITLTVDYKYDGSPRKRPIIVNYDIRTPPNFLPLIIFSVVIGFVIIGLLVWWISRLIKNRDSRIQITLQELTSIGGGKSDRFALENGHTVYFQASESDSSDPSRHLFDVNCQGYLTFDGKDLFLHQSSGNGETSYVLSDGEDFSLRSTSGDSSTRIQVNFGETSEKQIGVGTGDDGLITRESTVSDENDPLLR